MHQAYDGMQQFLRPAVRVARSLRHPRAASVSASVVFVLICSVGLALGAQGLRPADQDTIQKIRQAADANSQVMQIVGYLTDVYGPRLTGSPSTRNAAEWAMKQMNGWGISNVHLENWSFGRGWVNERMSAQVISPTSYPLIAYPLAWTPGTKGLVTAEAIIAAMADESGFEPFRGRLKGKIVLLDPPRDLAPAFEVRRRYTDEQLAELKAPRPERSTPPQDAARAAQQKARQEFVKKRTQFLLDEGIVAVFEPGRGDGGTVFVQAGGSRNPKDPPAPARIGLAVEHYNRIYRTLEKKVPVTVELNVQNRFFDDQQNSFNIIGEIPGTDKKDEVVMIGAHFDSWHTGTGATDNAIGSAVMLEAIRILKASGVGLRRTVRIALWTGEEQGLLGSREYVKKHFGDPKNTKPEHAKLSAYFNVDSGSGKIRGIYLQENEGVSGIFSEWLQPFKDVGMTTLAVRSVGGTDHLSFDAAGLPGFNFIQDPLEYNARTHHSNVDVYDRVLAQDAKQIVTIVASFAVLAANHDSLLPRKSTAVSQSQLRLR